MLSRGGRYSSKVDVYSFGIVMFELLTRRTPYEGTRDFPDRLKERLEYIQGGGRPWYGEEDRVSGWYCELMERCWDGDPEKRPSFDEIQASFLRSPDSAVKETIPFDVSSDSASAPLLRLSVR